MRIIKRQDDKVFEIVMNAAAPEGTPPRRISYKKPNTSCPGVPRRGPEAGNSHKFLRFSVKFKTVSWYANHEKTGRGRSMKKR